MVYTLALLNCLSIFFMEETFVHAFKTAMDGWLNFLHKVSENREII